VFYRLDRGVLEDEDEGEEDDVGNDDENNGDASPLEGDDAPHSPVGLLRRHGPDAVCVRRHARAFGRGAVVGERGEVNLDAVAKRGELDDDGQARKDQQGDPEIRQAVLVVDVARRPEPERHAAEDEGDDDADGGDAPADGLRKPHKVPPDDQLPADLEMERQGAQENPHHTCPAAHDEEEARSATHGARLHRIRRDLVEALLRVPGKGNDKPELGRELASFSSLAQTAMGYEEGVEAYVHKDDCHGEADAQIMPVRLVDG
jgi:hypothetical protein